MKIDAVCEGQFLRKGSGSSRPDIQGLTRQVKQEVGALKCLGFSLVTLGLAYVSMCIVNLVTLSRSSFGRAQDNRWSEEDLYQYTWELNIMKLSHSCALLLLTFPIAFLTARKKVTTKKRYNTLLTLTLVAELCYVMPLMFNIKKTLDKKGADVGIFSAWLPALLRDTNVNIFGINCMILITIAIFTVVLLIQFLTCALTNSIKQLERLRDKVHFDLICD